MRPSRSGDSLRKHVNIVRVTRVTTWLEFKRTKTRDTSGDRDR